MADPFPIVATSANLIKVLWRCGSYAKKIIESGGTIDDDIFDLDREIHGLISVNESLKEAYHAEMLRVLPRTSLADIDRINTLWRNVGTLVKDCQKPAEELEELMADIIGKDSSSTSKLGDKLGGKLDNLKKTIRREKKDDDFKDIRMRLMNYQNSLQILLTALNLYGILSTSGCRYSLF
jgi:hypothetical protein